MLTTAWQGGYTVGCHCLSTARSVSDTRQKSSASRAKTGGVRNAATFMWYTYNKGPVESTRSAFQLGIGRPASLNGSRMEAEGSVVNCSPRLFGNSVTVSTPWVPGLAGSSMMGHSRPRFAPADRVLPVDLSPSSIAISRSCVAGHEGKFWSGTTRGIDREAGHFDRDSKNGADLCFGHCASQVDQPGCGDFSRPDTTSTAV